MIDSILLKIPVREFQNTDLFTSKRLKTDHRVARVETLLSEKTNSFKKQGVYSPLVWLETQNRRGLQRFICIQVSLPKLMFGTNLFEVDETHFNQIVTKLHKLLAQWKIYISREQIAKGYIARIDFGKIIKLPKNFTNATDFIEKLEKSGYRSRSDLTKRDVRQGKEGYWIKYYNSTSSVTFYDKMAEINSQGYTEAEKGLIKLLQQRRLTKNILRFEVSLQKTQKVGYVLNRITRQKKRKYTFEEVFKEEIAKNVLLYYLNSTFNQEMDFLCQFGEQEIRTQIRNLFGYKKSKVHIYFTLREIEERGSQIVFDEIKYLHGHSYLKGIRKDLTALKDRLKMNEKEKILPVKFLENTLIKFKIYTTNINPA